MYIDKDGKRVKVRGKVGDNALYLAHRYGIEMEGMFGIVMFIIMNMFLGDCLVVIHFLLLI